jgi:hypothetical protein
VGEKVKPTKLASNTFNPIDLACELEDGMDARPYTLALKLYKVDVSPPS